MDQTISLSVPARPEFIFLLRTVVASIAGRLELPYEVLEDMRLAVHEASADLLAAGGGARTLSLRIGSEGDSLTVILWCDSDLAEWPRGVVRDELTWQILSSLTDEAKILRHEGHPGIRLRKRIEARASG